MKFTDIPLSTHFGLKEAEPQSDYVLYLDESPALQNHLGQLHAAVLFGLVETSSAHFLQQVFQEIEEGLIPVIRKVDIKYSRPGKGRVFSKVNLIDSKEDILTRYKAKGRVSLVTEVYIENEEKESLVGAQVQWFFQQASA